MLIWAYFWNLLLEGILDCFGSTFEAFGGQKVAKMSSHIDAKICMKKVASEEAWMPETSAEGGGGGGKPPPWG